MTHRGAWVPLDLESAPATAAAAVVHNRCAEEGLASDSERTAAIEALVRRQLERYADDEQALVALALYPTADDFPVAFATARYEELDGSLDFDDIVEALAVPEPMLERPLEREVLETASGPALRLRQCHREPHSPAEEQVYDQLVYAWILGDEDGQALALFSTTFHDLSDSQVWRDDFDEMARSVKLVLE